MGIFVTVAIRADFSSKINSLEESRKIVSAIGPEPAESRKIDASENLNEINGSPRRPPWPICWPMLRRTIRPGFCDRDRFDA